MDGRLKRNGWRRREKNGWGEVKNVDLWQRTRPPRRRTRDHLYRVAGHSGHPENDRCDELAVAAYQQYLRR